MNIFQLTYFLSQACLGEITPNFRKIYFTTINQEIMVYFILEEKNDAEIEDIKQEIMSIFEMLVKVEEDYEKYEINFEIIIEPNDFPSNYGQRITIYSRKELFD